MKIFLIWLAPIGKIACLKKREQLCKPQLPSHRNRLCNKMATCLKKNLLKQKKILERRQQGKATACFIHDVSWTSRRLCVGCYHAGYSHFHSSQSLQQSLIYPLRKDDPIDPATASYRKQRQSRSKSTHIRYF